MRGLNVTMDNTFMKDFCELNDFSSLIDKPTFYKNFDKSTYINLILTNKALYFQHSNVLRLAFPIFIC